MWPWKAEFDFLKAEDRGASESWRHRSQAGGLPCKETAPGADCLPLSAQHLYQLPHKRSDSSRSRLLHKQSICFQILKPKSIVEKDIQILNGLEREGWFLLMCVCTQDTSNQLCKQTGAINWKFPGFPATGGGNWHRKRKSKVRSHQQARELKEEQIQVTGPKMFSVFYNMFSELVQSFHYILMQHPNNFVLERRDRAEQLFSNSSVLALFTEILVSYFIWMHWWQGQWAIFCSVLVAGNG